MRAYRGLPPREEWTSSITGETLSVEEYEEAWRIWRKWGFTYFSEWYEF